MVERGKIMDFAVEDMSLNEANSSSCDELNGIQNQVQIKIKDGAIWMPIYTRPLHEFRLCEYCKDHEIPFYLPLVPGFKIHNVYKGQERHTYKKEIFYPVLGKCQIRQRNIHDDKMIIDEVENGLKQVNIIPEYTHEITNLGKDNSYTLMWISEVYNPETHDTYRAPVDKE